MKRSTKTTLTILFVLCSLVNTAASIVNYLIGNTYTSAVLAIGAISCFLILLECVRIETTDGAEQ